MIELNIYPPIWRIVVYCFAQVCLSVVPTSVKLVPLITGKTLIPTDLILGIKPGHDQYMTSSDIGHQVKGQCHSDLYSKSL